MPKKGGDALTGMSFALLGSKADVGLSAKEFKDLVEGAGGSVVTQVDAETTALLVGAKELEKKKPHAKLASARDLNIPVKDISWLHELLGGNSGIVAEAPEGGSEKSAKRELSGVVTKYRERPIEGSDILKPPEGRAGEVLVTHDSEFGYTPYNAVLNIADVTTGTNKFYRMAVLKKGKKFEFYTVWGRIGTENGGEMSHDHATQVSNRKILLLLVHTFLVCSLQESAIAEFEEKFEKFCKFRWSKRHRYVKQPGAYQWVALDDGVEAVRDANLRPVKIAKVFHLFLFLFLFFFCNLLIIFKSISVSVAAAAAGGLDPRVRAFLSLIFDVAMMQETLVKFNVDVKKMPLGKLNTAQLLRGYEVLSNVADLLKQPSPNPALLDDASNRFYTLVKKNRKIFSFFLSFLRFLMISVTMLLPSSVLWMR